MAGFPSPFGDDDDSSGGLFGDYDEFDAEHNPTPGQFLRGHDVLTGEDHVEFHQVTKEIFEERSVYDMTFGYNLARLNLDTRHPKAGYRYAEESDDPSILRAEFTPTTPFCPQSDTLTKGSFRAWNGLSERHDYDLVRVRVDQMHHRYDEINEALEELEAEYLETGTLTHVPEGGRDGPEGRAGGSGRRGGKSGCSDGTGGTSRGYGPDAPF
ncbi:hypothetical protein [Halorussus salinisoli]|uniref:hypothetical protein n=1 Tax=Halorussus salinisoli TaxID=2558242 RepID=UPI0010C21D38|nr:hypothetical protein [Halorussus salinisoli]